MIRKIFIYGHKKLDNADSTNSNIDFNGYKLYVNGSAIN